MDDPIAEVRRLLASVDRQRDAAWTRTIFCAPAVEQILTDAIEVSGYREHFRIVASRFVEEDRVYVMDEARLEEAHQEAVRRLGEELAGGLGLCTLCEAAPATTRWGLPVCQPCFDGLVNTQAELEKMEAADPHLAEMGRRVEESFRQWLEERDR